MAEQTTSVTFCSINKKGSPLYRIADAVLSRAFRNLGIRFALEELPPKRISAALDIGRIDGDTFRIYDFNNDNRYPNLVRVEEPILNLDHTAFTKLSDLKVNGWQSLLPYRILYLSGIKLVENELEAAGIPPENRLSVYDIDTAFHLLNAGRGDIFIISPPNGRESLKNLGLTHSGIRLVLPPLATTEMYPYMHKRHLRLSQQLAEELRKMKASGLYGRLINVRPE